MRKLPKFVGFFGLAGIVAIATMSACGDDTQTGGSGGSSECNYVKADGCYDASCATPGPALSFATDVLPVFERSCALSASCHGNPSSPTDSAGYRMYLGELKTAMKPSDVAKIRSLIIGQPSHAAPSLNIVEPGKPESSFLMLKMDGAHKCAANACGDKCGESMPQGGILLDIPTRNIVRDWIAQGALDN